MLDLTLDNIQHQNTLCKRCELYRKCHSITVGEGTIQSSLVIVVDPPGVNEELMAVRPRIILDKILREAKIAVTECYITPIVKCASYHRLGKYKKPIAHKSHHIEACKYWIWNELKLIQPKVVITMGKLSAEVLLELDKNITLKSILGEQIRVSYINSIFIPTYSPTYLLNLSEWHTTKTIKLFQNAKAIIDEPIHNF